MSQESSIENVEPTAEQLVEAQVATFLDGPSDESGTQAAVSQETPETAAASEEAANSQTQAANAPTQSTENVEVPEEDIDVVRKQLADLMGVVAAQQMQQQTTQQTQPELVLPDKPTEITSLDFLQGADPADVLADPAAFNVLLNRVATTAAQAGKRAAMEGIIRSIPEIVQRSTSQQLNVNRAVEDFYKKNPDLVPFKPAMGTAVLQVHAENPAISMDALMEGAASRVRDVLRLRNTRMANKPVQPAAVAAGSGGISRTVGAGTGQLPNKLEMQISRMLDNV